MIKVKFILNSEKQLRDGYLIKDKMFMKGYKISYDNDMSIASLILVKYFKVE